MWQIIEFVMLGTTFELFLLLFILLTLSSLYSSSTESGNAISVAWRWSCGTAPIECALFTFTFSLWIGHIWTITWRGCVHLHLESCTNEIREVAVNLIALHCPVLRVPAMTWHAAWNTSQQNICSVWGCETQTQKQLNPSMIPHVVCCKGGHEEKEWCYSLNQKLQLINFIFGNPLLINSLTINSVFVPRAEHHGFLLPTSKIRVRVVSDVSWCWEAVLQWLLFDPRQERRYY